MNITMDTMRALPIAERELCIEKYQAWASKVRKQDLKNVNNVENRKRRFKNKWRVLFLRRIMINGRDYVEYQHHILYKGSLDEVLYIHQTFNRKAGAKLNG